MGHIHMLLKMYLDVNHEHIGARMITNRFELRDVLPPTGVDDDFAADLSQHHFIKIWKNFQLIRTTYIKST